MTRRQTVLIAESGSGYGGTAKYLADFVRLVDRTRFDLHVVAAHEGPFIARIRDQGLPVTLRPGWRYATGRREQNTGPLVVRYARYGLGTVLPLVVVVPAIIWWLMRRRVRLVHLNNELLSHIPLLIAARLCGSRVLCHLHGWRPLTRTERWAAGLVHEFISVTHAGARFYSRELGGRTVTGIPNGVVLNGAVGADARARVRSELGLPETAQLVVAVGRLIPLKGYPVFIDALARAIHANPAVHGVIVGSDPLPDGRYRRELEQRIAELGLAERIRLIPWRPDVHALYAASDVVVQPSVEPESFGFVVLEGMAAGKPVIASRTGGMVDLIEEERTGLLVEPGDCAGLAAAIERVVADRGLAAQWGQRGRERVRAQFTMDRNVEAVSRVYEEMLR